MLTKIQAEKLYNDLGLLITLSPETLDMALQLGEGISDNPNQAIGLITEIKDVTYSVDGGSAQAKFIAELENDGSVPEEELEDGEVVVTIIAKVEDGLVKAYFTFGKNYKG